MMLMIIRASIYKAYRVCSVAGLSALYVLTQSFAAVFISLYRWHYGLDVKYPSEGLGVEVLVPGW
jgi:hypothetical protein